MKKKLQPVVRCTKEGVIINNNDGTIREYKFNTVIGKVNNTIVDSNLIKENINYYLNNNSYNINNSEKRKKQIFNKFNIHIVYPKIVNQLYLSLPKES